MRRSSRQGRVQTLHHNLPSSSLKAASVAETVTSMPPPTKLNPLQSALTKFGLLTFMTTLATACFVTLPPQEFLYRIKLLDRVTKEKMALRTTQFCARWLLRLIPFCKMHVVGYHDKNPQPSIWVCNHISMVDFFLMLAADRQLRGPNRRPIKVVYWKQLEANPVLNLFFKQTGCIPIQMADNGHGTANEYDKSSFRSFLKATKQAFAEGFDIGILPEGQLNPTPEKGLLPVFGGAYTLAKMSKRPIQMMGLYGAQKIWHPIHGIAPEGRRVKIRSYPYGWQFDSADDFSDTFSEVVGHFGAYGEDLNLSKLRRLVKEKGTV